MDAPISISGMNTGLSAGLPNEQRTMTATGHNPPQCHAMSRHVPRQKPRIIPPGILQFNPAVGILNSHLTTKQQTHTNRQTQFKLRWKGSATRWGRLSSGAATWGRASMQPMRPSSRHSAVSPAGTLSAPLYSREGPIRSSSLSTVSSPL
jgi:hypothetical protein